MRGAPDDPAQVDRPDLARGGRVGHVVLLELTGAPAGHVQHLVVDGQVDVADQRRDRREGFEGGRQVIRVRRLGRDGDDLVRRPVPPVAVPAPHRRGQVGRRDHHADEPPGRVGVVGGRSSSTIWCSAPRSTALLVPALGEVPEVQRMAVLLAEQQFRHQAVLDHRGGAPLAGDQRVLVQVPPGVVGQVLRSAIGLPGAQHVEGVVVEQRDPARAPRRRPARRGRSGRSHPGRSATCAGGSSRPWPPARQRRSSCAAGAYEGRAGCRRRGCGNCACRAAADSAAAGRPRPCRGRRASRHSSRRSSRSGAARPRGSAARPSRRPSRSRPRPRRRRGRSARRDVPPRGRTPRRRPASRSVPRPPRRHCGRRSGP